MALHTEAPHLGLELPKNFPDGWQEVESNSIGSKKKISTDNEADTSLLHLTTSKLQKNISDTLKGIGFDHTLEHIISTDELNSDYGISLSTEDQEFLSLDIANLDEKIGIEVDGPGHFVHIIDGGDSAESSSHVGGAMKTGKATTGWAFTANAQQQVNGPTALKHRLMNHLGWSVVHIPYFEWRDKENEEEYCKQLIKGL